jgi:hypothetical protein
LNIKRKKKLSRDWGINKVLALHIRIIATFRQTTKRRNKKKKRKKGIKDGWHLQTTSRGRIDHVSLPKKRNDEGHRESS